MIKKVKAYVEKYHMLAAGDVIVAGVSGGADSVCLLLVLLELQKEIPFRTVVVHINHGIRKEAAEDAAYVRTLCEQFGIPFYLVEADAQALANKNRLSLEEAGRHIRYRAFEDVLMKENGGIGRIAVAHNRNDRAETMLFHLFRGSGLNGLAGIRPVRDNIIRPLLCLDRTEIEAYVTDKGVHYCTDKTNAEEIYTRNKIRHRILPPAEAICEGAVGHMAEAADILAEAYDFIKQTANGFCDTYVIEENGRLHIPVDAFNIQKPVVQKEILYQCVMKLTESGHNITGAHIRAAAALFTKEGSKRIMLPRGLIVKREYEAVTFAVASAEPVCVPETTYADITGECVLEAEGLGTVEVRIFPYEKSENIPEKTYTKWFDYDKIIKSLTLRTRQTGDYLTINEKLSEKTLKDYMIQEKIPRDIRNRLYVLADGHHILWVIGYRISQNYKVDAQTKTILQVHVRRKESVTWLRE